MRGVPATPDPGAESRDFRPQEGREVVLGRREFLAASAAAAAGYLIAPRAASADVLAPGRRVETIRGHVSRPGYVVPPGHTLRFDPARNTTLEVSGNVVVNGTLEMRPEPNVTHTLRFVGVTESAFVGSGMDPIASDVGLWVMGRGRLDAVGSPKRAWARVEGDVEAGATTVTLDVDPKGWDVGDRIVITPTAPVTDPRFWEQYDETRISRIEGRTVTLASPTAHAHPSCTLPDGRVMGAEVLDLTRNVRIQGTRAGRSHIFIRSSRPQTIEFVEMAHLGPQKDDGEFVLGRWALHFHHARNESRGSLVRGCVVHHCGSRAFVPHASHGIAMRNCIVHDSVGEAFWWDRDVPEDNTTDILWDRCVASKVQKTGFMMNGGGDNLARDCVSVGGFGYNTSGGAFLWPGGLAMPDDFAATDCVAHNNEAQGIRVWQNGQDSSRIDGFISYRNDSAGTHGAYGNKFDYRNCIFTQNLNPYAFHALSAAFEDCTFDASGGPYAAHTGKHAVEGQDNVLTSCRFIGATEAGLLFAADPTEHGEKFTLIDCGFDGGNEFWMDSNVPSASYVMVRDETRGNLTLRRADQPGTFRPEWNASVT
jgi:hypothetical protein